MALDRYHLAVLALANSTEDWKSRLCNAVNQIFPIHPFELPEGLWERHASLLKSVTFLPGDKGAINATVFQLRQKLAERPSARRNISGARVNLSI
jgi:hypothetical protein